MESQKINILLEKYFDAETTLGEENELINYFHSDFVDEELKHYIPMFSGLREISINENPGLGDDLMNFIIDSEQKEKRKYLLRTRIITALAASVILGILAVNFYSHQKPVNNIVSDPNQAYEEAMEALKYAAGTFNEGLAELSALKKVEDAADPLHSGISALNEGFNQMKEIKVINKEFKKEKL